MAIIFPQNHHKKISNPIIALRLLLSEFLFTSLELSSIALNCLDLFKVDYKSMLIHSTHNLNDVAKGRTGESWRDMEI